MLQIIKDKISSRKFWTMIGSMIACFMVYQGADQESIDSIVSLIGMIGTGVTYILVQGKIDHTSSISQPQAEVKDIQK